MVDLPVSTPSDENVDPGGLSSLLDALEHTPGLQPHSLMVLRHGRVIASGWWAPYSAERVHHLYSLSKSFTSTAIGLAVAEGRLGLDDLVIDHFPEYDDEVTDAGTRSLRVRHLAAMATGHTDDAWERSVDNDPADPVRGFLRLPPDRAPGSVFAYNQSATYTLAAIVQRTCGSSLTDYLRPRLFEPLGIGPVAWQQLPPGRDIGYSGLHATTEALAALGLLYLRRGVWDGRQLLPRSWVADATRKQIETPREPNPDWRQGYGFQFWMGRHGFRGDGAFGQFCLVLPEQDVVVAMTQATQDMQLVLDAVWEHLIPAVDRPGGDDDDLARRLEALVLPPAPAGAEADRSAWNGVSFEPASSRSWLQAVELHAAESGWRLVLRDRRTTVSAPMGTGEWLVDDGDGVPVAVSAGWVDATMLRAQVQFLESPHGVELTCSLPGRTFTARWLTEPLHPPSLRLLAAPSK